MSSIKALLLRNPLGDLPQAFQQEQGRFSGSRIDGGAACVIGQTGSDRSMIAVRQADNEVWISASSNTDKLHAVAMQWMVRVSHGHPFLRWLVKGGSVL